MGNLAIMVFVFQQFFDLIRLFTSDCKVDVYVRTPPDWETKPCRIPELYC